MRYIKLFESSNKSKLKEDIDGLLIELKDNNFFVKVNIEKESVIIVLHQENMIYDRFKYSEVEDYIDTTIDYLKYFWNKDVTVKYEIHYKFKGYSRYRDIDSKVNLIEETRDKLLNFIIIKINKI
jgi:hypothetical protein